MGASSMGFETVRWKEKYELIFRRGMKYSRNCEEAEREERTRNGLRSERECSERIDVSQGRRE